MTQARVDTRTPRPTIKIERDVIEQSKRRDSGHCMIAEAIKVAVPDAKSISVDLATIRWTDRDKGVRYTYLTPRVAQVALIAFDQGDNDIQPFAFRLRGATVTKAEVKKTQNTIDLPKGATIVTPPRNRKNHVATRVGGKPPPIGPLSNNPSVRVGRRREYGLRSLTK